MKPPSRKRQNRGNVSAFYWGEYEGCTIRLNARVPALKEVMRGVLAVPKKRLDELVARAKEESPRNGDPHAPGQKRVKRKRRS